MKQVLFKIVKRVEISQDFLTIDFYRKNPTHSISLYKAKEIIVILEYKPNSKLNETRFINSLKEILMKQYNAYSIEVGMLEKQIKSKL